MRWAKVMLTSVLCVCLLSGCSNHDYGQLVAEPEQHSNDVGQSLKEKAAMHKGQIEILFELEDEMERGYAVQYDIYKCPVDAFEGEITQVSDIIRKQYENHVEWSSTSPDYWAKDFESVAALRKYLGCELMFFPEWDIAEMSTKLTIYGKREGSLERLHTEIWYQTDNITMQAVSSVYTEDDSQDNVFYRIGDKNQTYEVSEYMAECGQQCTIVTNSANLRGYLGKDGYMIKDGVLYNLHMAYQEEYEAEAQNRMKQWYDLY
ncbi:hypothetical protein [Anaerolentibacter hominis]|uniref:hypothetical protein n=1 Tax=Anaerolentibacter hominis TaxID=3079009 RepID=UPI0031B847AE